MTAYVIVDDMFRKIYISVYMISAHVLSLALRLNYIQLHPHKSLRNPDVLLIIL